MLFAMFYTMKTPEIEMVVIMRKVPVLQNITLGGVIISLITFIGIMIHVVTPATALEGGISALVAFICIIIFKSIYQEFEARFQREQRLKIALVNHIFLSFADLPGKNIIQDYIEESLAKQSSPYARIKTLKRLSKNHDALEAFIEGLRQQYNDIAVLKNLGLSWDGTSYKHQ